MRYCKSIFIGLLFGSLAKIVDLIPGNTLLGYLGLKDLLNYLGVFIVVVCFVEYNSKNTKEGIVKTLCFMLSMVISYYCATLFVYRYFPYRYLLLWSIVAVCSPLLYILITLRRKNGHIAILGTLIPNLLLGSEAYKFISTSSYFTPQLWFDVIAVIIIFWKLPLNKKNRLFSILGFVILIPFLEQLDLINQLANYLYGLMFR
ncbi:hypothetical protein [Candidatus Merdisoma sp. JLR.KK006]|uniref:hypothetical protein n=1 Tax=Candidatus Merdisoma sp. JLR.KK006 TaxID=3112626 RepID=UPI002FF1D338